MLWNPYAVGPAGVVQRRLKQATRFMRPPGPFKRAKIRNWFYRHSGPYESPVKRFVRLREKNRIFSMLPPPRIQPRPRPAIFRYLKPVASVPRVSNTVLERRLAFLLSHDAIRQQLYTPLRPGQTPYQAEKATWTQQKPAPPKNNKLSNFHYSSFGPLDILPLLDRPQMTELRRIYRAQYLKKLAEVANEERLKQIELMDITLKHSRQREAALQNSLYEDRRRRAILKDHKSLQNKLYEARKVVQTARKMSRRLRLYRYINDRAHFIDSHNCATHPAISDGELFNRNISVPQLLRDMGISKDDDQVAPYIEKHTAYQLYQHILNESFAFLPEDEGGAEQRPDHLRGTTPTEASRAHVAYQHFSTEEKVNLLNTKIELVRQKIAESEKFVLNSSNEEAAFMPSPAFWQKLLDQLEATKAVLKSTCTVAVRGSVKR